MNENYCNNCGKQGHLYHQCKMPIISIGIIMFRYNKEQNIEYLMIRRKDTLGFIDFMRGKYSLYNKDYLLNMFNQMTSEEKYKIKTMTFYELWKDIWKTENISNQYKVEEVISKEKFNSLKNGITNKNIFYNIETIIQETDKENWEEPEWGFPKGRRNYMEKDYDCALREFVEETGFNITKLKNIQNILPFEEIFTGSNYKSYKHKYFVSYIDYDETMSMDKFEKTEVSKMDWNTYEECLHKIRPYNLEKKRLITNVHNTLSNYKLVIY